MDNIDKIIESMINEISHRIEAKAKELAPKVSQKLAGDIQVSESGKFSRIVGNSKAINYAVFVHNGTKPHKILPKNGKALKFNGIVRKSVNHKGSKANPYFEKALEESMSMSSKVVKKYGEQIAKDIAMEIKKGWK